MAFSLIDLSYAPSALAPVISEETIALHHGRHHAKYVTTTNQLISQQSDLASASLVGVARAAKAAQHTSLFNNAAQVWNHNFYWMSLAPSPAAPSGPLADMIARDFGATDDLLDALLQEAVTHFSNGWVWLLQDGDGLAVRAFHDADSPLLDEQARPLLTIDVWEHAYYVDYRNARDGYVRAVLSKRLNWEFAGRNLDGQGTQRADQQPDNAT